MTGLVYMGDEVQAFGGHAWNEVVIDGKWVPIDATWNETTLNPTHITFGHGFKADKILLQKKTLKFVSASRADKGSAQE